jgi:hypothetical protein
MCSHESMPTSRASSPILRNDTSAPPHTHIYDKSLSLPPTNLSSPESFSPSVSSARMMQTITMSKMATAMAIGMPMTAARFIEPLAISPAAEMRAPETAARGKKEETDGGGNGGILFWWIWRLAASASSWRCQLKRTWSSSTQVRLRLLQLTSVKASPKASWKV